MLSRHPDWVCTNCRALRRARVHLHWLGHLAIWVPLLVGACLWLPAWWALLATIPLAAIFGWRRTCAVCGHPHLIPGAQYLADREGRTA